MFDTIPNKSQIKKGIHVLIETKVNQGTGNFTTGIVAEILTSSNSHPHGIMVKLQDGQIGRVKSITENTVPLEHTVETNAFENLDKKTIPQTEDKNNEFKEFYQYDKSIEYLTQSDKKSKIGNVKRNVSERFACAVCSFANSYDGGFVYLGMRSDGIVSGLEKDKKLEGFSNYSDSFANHIRDKLEFFLSDRVFLTSKLQMKFRTIDEKTICLIQVLPSDKPVYLKTEGGKAFFVRGSAPRSEKLDEEEQFRYIRSRFPNYR